jgi:hypothetical protein
MKNLWLIGAVFILLVLGCQRTPFEELTDDQIPFEELIEVDADDLSYAYYKGEGATMRNSADDKYGHKWVKVTGTLTDYRKRSDDGEYEIQLRGYGGSGPEIQCLGKLTANTSKPTPQELRKITLIGKLVRGGKKVTILLRPCKFLVQE